MTDRRKPGIILLCCAVFFLACCVPASAGVPGDTDGDTFVSEGELATAIQGYLNATYAGGIGGLDRAALSLAAHNTLNIPYGQIVVAVSSTGDLLQPSYIDGKGVPPGSLIYEGLVTRTNDKDHIGWLATSWEPSADGTTWTFHIPEGATWHDGVPVTASDVVFSYYYLKEKGLKNSGVLKHVTSVETPDDTTVVYYCDCCMPLFADVLATGPGVAIFPEHIWGDIEDPAKQSDPKYIGSGPFKYVSSVSGDSYKLEAYRDYHGTLPYVDKVVRKLYSSQDTRVLALRNGDVDYVYDLAPTTARSLQDKAGIGVTTIPSGGKAYEVAFTCDVYPANITEFRQALSHAVNRDAMCSIIDSSATRATDTVFLVPALAGDQVNEDTNGLYDYDLDKAKTMLADAGFTLKTEDGKNILYGPDNAPVAITIPLGDKASINKVDEKILLVLREDWETELGIRITVENLQSDSSTYKKRIGETAVHFDGMPRLFHDDISRLDNFQKSPRGHNYYHFDDATFNGLIDDLSNTMDAAERQAIGDRLQVILSEQVPCIPVCSMDSFNAYRSDRFAGFNELILEDGGDINILSHVKPASTEVNG
ncbi:MAG: ABC transporter substrate-binding protein [Methanomicrobiaceae archaeon]|uniref:ABC transporter substrate-binding protein n=1 Tax=Methanoculleus sp. TaxID=90427 RepID=UPI00320D1013|nr:ABC transporter substrate-binding protein [Methanomicrobiaceae archaeon]